MARKASLRCEDCKQFYLRKGRCAWSVPECTGPNSTFAQECANYTDQNGFAPLLDCPEDQLPAWYRQKELLTNDPKTTNAKTSSGSDGSIPRSRKRSNKRSRQQQAKQMALWSGDCQPEPKDCIA